MPATTQWPLYEGLYVGRRSGRSVLRCGYFTDDRGQFIRGTRPGPHPGRVRQATVHPLLAIFAACSMFFFVFYNVPAQCSSPPCTATRGLPTSRSARTSWAASAVTGATGSALTPPYQPTTTSPATSIATATSFFRAGTKLPQVVALPTRKVICRSQEIKKMTTPHPVAVPGTSEGSHRDSLRCTVLQGSRR